MVATDTNSHKAQGGKRVIYTSHSPVWDAKNRHNLPEEMDLSYASIDPIFEGTPDTIQTTPLAQTHQSAPEANRLESVKPDTLSTLYQWMEKAGVEAAEIQTLVAQKGHFPPETTIEEYPEKFVRGWIMKNWDQVVTTIQNDPEHTPF